jgi:hypothetical protein
MAQDLLHSPTFGLPTPDSLYDLGLDSDSLSGSLWSGPYARTESPAPQDFWAQMAVLGFQVLTPLAGTTAADAISIHSPQGDSPHDAISVHSSSQGDPHHDDDNWSWMTNGHSASGDSGIGSVVFEPSIDAVSLQTPLKSVVSMRGFSLNGGNSAHTTTTYLSYLLAYHFILRCIY